MVKNGNSLTLTLIVAALVTLVVPATAASRPDAVPTVVAGTWSRTVTADDAKRRGQVATGVWRLNVKPSGAMSLFSRSSTRAVATGKLRTGTSGTLRMLDLVVVGGGRCPTDHTYRWRRTGLRLTLSTTADKCAGRAAVLVGTWRRA